MSEPIINRIIDGVHADNDPRYQPENTMRWARNGVIMDAGEGNYVWITIKGTKIEFSFDNADRIFSWCTIRERFFIITLNENDDDIKIYEILLDLESGYTRKAIRWVGSNSVLQLSYDNPITRIVGFYENDAIQRIYFTDNHNKPRVINAGWTGTGSFYGADRNISIDQKFIDFSPVISNGFGNFRFKSLSGGGSLKAGTYFFAWRFFHKGYYTDWSYHSAGVKVNPGTVAAGRDNYQEFQGASPDTIVTKRINFQLLDLDTDYDSIQIAAFHSGDLNSASPGVIFYDGDIDGETLEIYYHGNENAGIVTIEELNEVSVVIEKCRDFDFIKQRAAILNVKTREELDLPNKLEVDIEPIQREVILDQTGYPDHTWTAGNKALFASMKGGFVWPGNIIRAGIQYYGVEAGVADINGTVVSFDEGEIITFKDFNEDVYIGTLTTGKLITTIALKKYRKGGTVPNSSYENYQWNTPPNNLSEEYLDFKSTTISNWLKGYPGGEIIRLGVLFFDLTGSPFFVRWLKNVDPTYSIGDITIPDRNFENGNIPLVRNYGGNPGTYGTWYEQTNGVTIGLKISNLDITKFKDQISGFMIVRAPIVRRNIGTGIINRILDLEDSLYSKHGFIKFGEDATAYPNAYDVYSPEDIFDLKDFSIEPGDQLVPLQYLEPFVKSELPPTTEETWYIGLGRRMTPGSVGNYSLYQKFYITEFGTDGAAANGALGMEHEILYSTKINIGDQDIAVDPRNAIKLYQRLGGLIDDGVGPLKKGANSKHSVVIVDTDDTGTNPIGHHARSVSSPIALLCNIKRPNNNPYGGQGDSALSNTYYISCGHYQEINDTVLADIEAGGRYVFNEIEIYGGDSYVCLMDINRIIPDYDEDDIVGHSIIFPVESRVNIAMREGVHVAKDRTYDITDNPLGIRAKTAEFKLPEYNYNDGYSTDDINDYYAPLPYNYTINSEFDVMVRWSPFKTNGERQDSFRRFLPNDYVQLNSEYGEGVNIRDKFNRLVYWQRDAVGYIPIDERALTQNEFGSPIQLGTGGVFERYDEMTNRIGNSHQFGLVESDMGFHWYDSKREIFVTLTDSLKFSQDSVAKGLNNYFENNIVDNITNSDNPFETYGINGGYDPYLKVVFYNFRLPGEVYKTIGFDIRRQKFIGEFDMPSMIFIRKNNTLLTVPFQSTIVYSHNRGDDLTIYGNKVTAELSLVVKNQNLDSLLFDSFKVNGNDEFFESITIQTSSLTKEETIQQLQAGQHRFVTKNYLYRNGKWHGTFPKVGRQRAVDTYLIVTFKTEKAMTKFLDMVTTTRKAY